MTVSRSQDMIAELGAAALNERRRLLKEHGCAAKIRRRIRQCSSLHRQHTSALHVIGDGTKSLRAKQITPKYFFVQELVRDGTVTNHYVKKQDQLADIGTEHLSKKHHGGLFNKIRDFGA